MMTPAEHPIRLHGVDNEPTLPAVDCCNPDHWFDCRVGWPGRHDGGLPGDRKTPCQTFEDAYENGLES